MPNPELLPGFSSWKLFLMETPVSCCKSSSSSKSQGLLLPPLQLHCLPPLGFVYFWLNSPSTVLVACSYLSPSGKAVIWVTLGAEPFRCGAQFSPCQAPVWPTDHFNLRLGTEARPFPLPAWGEAEVPKCGWYLLPEAVSVPSSDSPHVPPVPGLTATNVTTFAVLTWVPSL